MHEHPQMPNQEQKRGLTEIHYQTAEDLEHFIKSFWNAVNPQVGKMIAKLDAPGLVGERTSGRDRVIVESQNSRGDKIIYKVFIYSNADDKNLSRQAEAFLKEHSL